MTMTNLVDANSENTNYSFNKTEGFDQGDNIFVTEEKKREKNTEALKSYLINKGQIEFPVIWSSCAQKRLACEGNPLAYEDVIGKAGRSVIPYDLLPDIERLLSICRENIKKPVISLRDSDLNKDISFSNKYISDFYIDEQAIEYITSAYKKALMDGCAFLLINNFNTQGKSKLELLDIYSCFYEIDNDVMEQHAFSKKCSFFFAEKIISSSIARDIFGSSKKVDRAIKKGYNKVDTCTLYKMDTLINNNENLFLKKGKRVKVDPEKFVNEHQRLNEIVSSQCKYHRIYRRIILEDKKDANNISQIKDAVACDHFLNDVHLETEIIESNLMPICPLFLTDCNRDSRNNLFFGLYDYLKNDLLLLASLQSTMHNATLNSMNSSIFLEKDILVDKSLPDDYLKNGVVYMQNLEGRDIKNCLFPTPPAEVSQTISQTIQFIKNSIQEKLSITTTTKNLNSADQERLRKDDRSELNSSLFKSLDILSNCIGNILWHQSLDYRKNFHRDIDKSINENDIFIEELRKEKILVESTYANQQTSKERSLEKIQQLNEKDPGQFPISKGLMMKILNVDQEIIDEVLSEEKKLEGIRSQQANSEAMKSQAQAKKDDAMAEKYFAEAEKIKTETKTEGK